MKEEKMNEIELKIEKVENASAFKDYDFDELRVLHKHMLEIVEDIEEEIGKKLCEILNPVISDIAYVKRFSYGIGRFLLLSEKLEKERDVYQNEYDFEKFLQRYPAPLGRIIEKVLNDDLVISSIPLTKKEAKKVKKLLSNKRALRRKYENQRNN